MGGVGWSLGWWRGRGRMEFGVVEWDGEGGVRGGGVRGRGWSLGWSNGRGGCSEGAARVVPGGRGADKTKDAHNSF